MSDQAEPPSFWHKVSITQVGNQENVYPIESPGKRSSRLPTEQRLYCALVSLSRTKTPLPTSLLRTRLKDKRPRWAHSSQALLELGLTSSVAWINLKQILGAQAAVRTHGVDTQLQSPQTRGQSGNLSLAPSSVES